MRSKTRDAKNDESALHKREGKNLFETHLFHHLFKTKGQSPVASLRLNVVVVVPLSSSKRDDDDDV